MQESESQICGIVSTLVHLVEAVRVADLRDQLRVRVHSLEAQPEIRGKIRDDKGWHGRDYYRVYSSGHERTFVDIKLGVAF